MLHQGNCTQSEEYPDMATMSMTSEEVVGIISMVESLFPGSDLTPMNTAISKWGLTGNFNLTSKDGTLSVNLTITK